MELDALYVEALRRVARWADDTLETEVADAVLVAIGFELRRLGVRLSCRETGSETLH